MNATAGAIAAAVEQQGATTREIARTVQEVSATGGRTSTAMAALVAGSRHANGMERTILSTARDLEEVACTSKAELAAFLKLTAEADRDA